MVSFFEVHKLDCLFFFFNITLGRSLWTMAPRSCSELDCDACIYILNASLWLLSGEESKNSR